MADAEVAEIAKETFSVEQAMAMLAQVESTLQAWSLEGPPRNPRASFAALATRLQDVNTMSQSLASEVVELRAKSEASEQRASNIAETVVQIQAERAEEQGRAAEEQEQMATKRMEEQAQAAIEKAELETKLAKTQEDLHAEIHELRLRAKECENMMCEDLAASEREKQLRTEREALRASVEAYTVETTELRQREASLASQVASVLSPVSVMCRMRPMDSYKDKPDTIKSPFNVDGCEINVEGDVNNKKSIRTFRVDRVLDGRTTQGDVFGAAAPWVENVMLGGSSCVFSYGATGAGKTYTLLGDSVKSGCLGLAHHALKRLINGYGGCGVRLSMMEVYCDHIRDLLADTTETGGPPTLQCTRRDGQGRMLLDCVEILADTYTHAEDVLLRGFSNRTSDATLCNERSSRSHVVLTVQLIPPNSAQIGATAYGKTGAGSGRLVLVDLAGSENIQKSGADEGGKLLTEAKAINRSLSALSDVVEAIAKRQKFVPYRNSRLTMLLEEAFSGAKVLLLVHVSPLPSDAIDSGHSLQFGGRLRQVDFGAQQLRKDQEERLKSAHVRDQQDISQLRTEIEKLKKDRDAAVQGQQDLKQQVTHLTEQARERQRELTREHEVRSKEKQRVGCGVVSTGALPPQTELRSVATRIPSPYPQELRQPRFRQNTPWPRRIRESTPDTMAMNLAKNTGNTATRTPLRDLTNRDEEATMKQKASLGDFKAKTLDAISCVEKSIETNDEEDTNFMLATPTRKGHNRHMTESPTPRQTSPRHAGKDANEVISVQQSPTKSPRTNHATRHFACSLRPTNSQSSASMTALEKSPERQTISNGIVLQSAIRKHTRRGLNQEFGVTGNSNCKRVTFTEDPPNALSPPKWYMDHLEAAKVGNHRDFVPRRREAHDTSASDNLFDASQMQASRRHDLGDTLRRDRSDSALESLPRWR